MKLTRTERIGLATMAAAAAAALVLGWKLFLFLTDDAYISFRYVSNSLLGHGYVWNPPPFRPVEGYSNFLWVVLLDGIWRIAGMAPPESSVLVSLLLSGRGPTGSRDTASCCWDSCCWAP
jgi:arabinofuranosyltransferase